MRWRLRRQRPVGGSAGARTLRRRPARDPNGARSCRRRPFGRAASLRGLRERARRRLRRGRRRRPGLGWRRRISCEGDCDDSDPWCFPARRNFRSAVVRGDGVDNDCNGVVDDPRDVTRRSWSVPGRLRRGRSIGLRRRRRRLRRDRRELRQRGGPGRCRRGRIFGLRGDCDDSDVESGPRSASTATDWIRTATATSTGSSMKTATAGHLSRLRRW